jgi:hypothetical protein
MILQDKAKKSCQVRHDEAKKYSYTIEFLKNALTYPIR